MTVKDMNKTILEIIAAAEKLREEFEDYIREAAEREAGNESD